VTILGKIVLAAGLLAVGCATSSSSNVTMKAPVSEVVVSDEVVTEEVEEEQPRAYVRLERIIDRSSGRVSAKNRKVRADEMRDLIRKELAAAPEVTLEAARAEGLDIRQYTVDATIERLDRQVRGRHVEVVCELRLSISDRRGRMLSFLTGGVAVQVPKRTFRPQYEPQLQREALEGAAKKINRDLLAYIDSADAE
jgi:hypothetical protein